ncbi:glucuronate isomerase [Acidothermaceae bacterium B102]|nr:glucuronate isomerase [Acidothermaceae bacterium B102]
MRVLTLDDDRLLPSDPGTRTVAREIYGAVRALPIVSMHGHVDAALLAHNQPFPDPAQLLVVPDHYVTRMLVSQGESLEQLTTGDPREIWRRFCAGWHLFRGTPSRLWLEHELVDVFGVDITPSAESADLLYDELSAALRRPAFQPRALFERFEIELLATTDSPLSDLAEHLSIIESGWPGVVVPTFRPDTLVQINHPDWQANVQRLADISGIPTGTYPGYIAALEQRRHHFLGHGARATDHGVFSAETEPLDAGAASRIYQSALRGRLTPDQCDAFSAHMMFEMARMSRDDGLVMQIHPGVLRNHDPAIQQTFGSDRGFDIPVPVDFVHGLRPLLNAFGQDPKFRCIVFTIDETTYSRELAPLAGAYPSLRLGAPWWFLDSPAAMRRFREAVTETAGFYNTSGFVDDTRAFCSIPARHDVARRVDSGYLAELVVRGQLGLDEATETAIDLTVTLPRLAYAPR